MPILKNSRHEQFCKLVVQGMSLVRAYETLGYSPNRQNADKLRKKSNINARIAELRGKLEVVELAANERAIERLAITKEALAGELIPTICGNMGDYITLSERGTPNWDFRRCTRAQLSAIRALKIEEFMDGKGDDARPVRRIQVQLHDKVPSAAIVARLFSWIDQPGRPLPPRPIEEQLRAMTPEQRAADAAQLHERAIRRLLEADAAKKREAREKAAQRAANGGIGSPATIDGEATEVPDEGGK